MLQSPTVMMEKFPALVADANKVAIQLVDESALFKGDVIVQVDYSCINYKDALAVTGQGKILRSFPLIPGIDYAGEVVKTTSDDWQIGDKVILTGYQVGERINGGFSTYAGAQSDWLLPLPPSMTTQQAMICGSAGLTAAFAILTLMESGRLAAGGDVIVSGASGGVGSFAVLLLSRLHYKVTAITRPAAADYVRSLGAQAILSRDEMAVQTRPLEKARWHAAIDCVGGPILAHILAGTHYGGVVSACGLAGGVDLTTTVMPFILRGIRLDGIDSVMLAKQHRQRAWALLSTHLNTDDYTTITNKTITLSAVPSASQQVISGLLNGRIVVKL